MKCDLECIEANKKFELLSYKRIYHSTIAFFIWPISSFPSVYPYSSFCDSAICIAPLILGIPADLPFRIRKRGQEKAKTGVDKWEAWDFAAVNWDMKRKRVDIRKELRLSRSAVSTVLGMRKAVEASALIFNIETKESRGVGHVDLDVEVFPWCVW